MNEITIPDDLTKLTVEELDNLLAEINEAGKATADAAREASGEEREELLKTLEALKTAKSNVTQEIKTKVEAENAAQAAISEAATSFADPEDDDINEDTNEEVEEVSEVDPEDEAVAVTASGTFNIPARRRNRTIPVREEKKAKQELFHTSNGKLNDVASLGEAFKRAARASEINGDGIARVATFNRAKDVAQDQFVSERNNAAQNTAIIQAATPDDDFIAAAGGFCGPGEILTDVPNCGRTDRPVGSKLASIRARGKYQYSMPVPLDNISTGLGYWTEQNDIDALDDPDIRKSCYRFECQDMITATPVAIPLCFTYGTFAQWSNPEQIAAALARFDVALARHSEALILQRIHEQSMRYTFAAPIGESVQSGLTRLVGQLLSLAGYNGRNDLSGYSLIIPEALLNQVLVDARAKAFVGVKLSRQDIIDGLENVFGVSVIATPDVRALAPAPVAAFGTTQGGDVVALPCANGRHEILLTKLSSFVHGSDDVDIAIGTDIATAKMNDKNVFLETIETVEKRGCEPSFSVLYTNEVASGAQSDLVEWDATFCPLGEDAYFELEEEALEPTDAFPGDDLLGS